MFDSRPVCHWPSAPLVALAVALVAAPALSASDFSTYRGFTFGDDLATVARQAGMKPADATTVHQRPALIQELHWEPTSPFGSGNAKPDPVANGVLSFHDGALHRIVITYDRYLVEGLRVGDLVEGISTVYGQPQYPDSKIDFQSNYGDSALVLARWQDPGFCFDLVRTGDKASYALVLYSKQGDGSAQSAIREALRLDQLDAPRRRREAENQRALEDRRKLDQRRAANKPNFRP